MARRTAPTLAAVLLLSMTPEAQNGTPSVDWPMVARIREEGLQR